MDTSEVLACLARDKPQFHHLDAAQVKNAPAAGLVIPVGDLSLAVTPRVLRWIAEHVTPDMRTLETGAGYTTVLLTALGAHHVCCTRSAVEVERIRAYLGRIGVPDSKVTFVIGSTDESLPRLNLGPTIDFAYIDGCHGYPFPALDWHYADKYLKVGGLLGMDNVELRPVREHCDFLEENGTYRLLDVVIDGYFVRFYEKTMDENREWVDQAYSRAKRDPCDWGWRTRLRRKASAWIKPYLY